MLASFLLRHVGVCAGADRCRVRCWAGRVFAAPQMSTSHARRSDDDLEGDEVLSRSDDVSESATFQVTLYVVVGTGKGVFDSERVKRIFSTEPKKENIICISPRDKVAVKGASKKSEEE